MFSASSDALAASKHSKAPGKPSIALQKGSVVTPSAAVIVNCTFIIQHDQLPFNWKPFLRILVGIGCATALPDNLCIHSRTLHVNTYLCLTRLTPKRMNKMVMVNIDNTFTLSSLYTDAAVRECVRNNHT